jgi:hypothetical protein
LWHSRVGLPIRKLAFYAPQAPCSATFFFRDGPGQQQGNATLTMLIANGTLVKPGDNVAEFDRIAQAKAARDAAAKFDDLTDQTDQKAAEHRSNAAKRGSRSRLGGSRPGKGAD